MNTQEILAKVTEGAIVINKGRKFLAESVEVKNHLMEWYANFGTTLSVEEYEEGSFFVWDNDSLEFNEIR